MTMFGVITFTIASGIFGALWGAFTTGTFGGALLGALIATIVGGMCWYSMRMPQL